MRERIWSSLLLLGCSVAYASHDSVVESSQRLSFPSFISALKQAHIVFQAGGYWSHQGKAQHIDIDGLIGDDLTLSKRDGSNGLVGLGYYIDGHNSGRVQFSYGVNFFYLPKTSVSGAVFQEDLFTNLSYGYNLTHYPVYAAVKAKKSLSVPNLFLTVDAGIGPNFMRAGGFSEHSLDGGITTPDNAFSGHTSTTFSTTAGVGLQLANVFGEMPLECGYRFFYLGQGRLSKNTDQIINNLHTGSSYANAVLCAVRV
ncbi:hypothetical protein Lsan_3428 [Legionella santicrucis]|uniref:Outer membrane protein beta-barrel domain-containing protein n=1 Tax=Legionella santicrucis TaxID=45074 RepID=A0A0W0YGW5_9GAMM|nr:hypothetical protein [Legionella santicrucis]KTD55876.1 hypothetical protein Lsan_3428 [Legionella santicrucis]